MTLPDTNVAMNKALIVTGQLVIGGAERELLTFLEVALKRGWEFEVLCLTAGGAFQPEVERLIRRKVRLAPARSRLARWWWIRQAIKAWRPDIVHAWNIYPMFYLKHAFLRRPCPIIGFLQNTPDDMGEGRFNWMFRYLVKCPDGLVSNSVAALEGLRRMGIRVSPAVVIHNGVDRAFFNGQASPEVLARRSALPVVMGAGRMIPRKRMDWMIRAVRRLREEGCPFALWLVGDGPERSALERLADELDVRNEVVFWGMRKDMPVILAGVDVFLHCAWAEGLPNAVQEAMAAGLPVVAPRASGVPELVDHEIHGRLYETGDFEGCVQALRGLLADPVARVRMGRAARARAEAEYQPDQMASRLLDFYEDAICRFGHHRHLSGDSQAAREVAKPVVLYVGPRGPAVGGMVSYTEGYLGSPLNSHFDLRALPTDLLGKLRHRGLLRAVLNLANSACLSAAFVWRLVAARPAIVHITTSSYGGYYEKSLLAALARLGGRRVVMHIHGGEFGRFLGLGGSVRQAALRRLLRLNHGVIVLSEQAAQALRKAHVPDGRIFVVPNAVPLPRQTARPAEVAAGAPVFRALFLNSISEKKGIPEFVEASLQASRELPSFQAVVHGPDVPLVKEMQARIQAQGLTDRIRFAGPVSGSAKEQAFLSANVYVLPSHVEGIPMGLLEAMSYALPCVATSVGGIPGVIRNGINGLLVEPGDVPGLRDAMLRIARDGELGERLGGKARQTIDERFSWEVVAKALAGVYEWLMGRRDVPVAVPGKLAAKG